MISHACKLRMFGGKGLSREVRRCNRDVYISSAVNNMIITSVATIIDIMLCLVTHANYKYHCKVASMTWQRTQLEVDRCNCHTIIVVTPKIIVDSCCHQYILPSLP